MELTFLAEVWRYKGDSPWHFVTVPRELSAQLKAESAGSRKPFGSVRVTARIGRTRWQTSLFPDGRLDAYLLPLKADVRRREQIVDGMTVEVTLLDP